MTARRYMAFEDLGKHSLGLREKVVLAADYDTAEKRAETAEAECARLRERVAALRDEWQNSTHAIVRTDTAAMRLDELLR